MKYFFAGAEQNPFFYMLTEGGARRFLVSFFYMKENKIPRVIYDDTIENKEFIVDSGGYSARVAFKEINIRKYISFLKKLQTSKNVNGKLICSMNLDGNRMDESLANQKIIEDAGLTPLPIYHWSDYASEHREVLDDWVKTYKFIAVGGLANQGLTKHQKRKYLSYVFARTTDKIKIHCLGMSSIQPCEEYPFYTVDSTTWLQFQKFAASRAIKDSIMRKYMAKNVHYSRRNVIEIGWYLKFEEHITQLWERRGVVWKD